MNKVTASGQNVEKAVQTALSMLGISREKAAVRVIDEGKKGFFGLWKSKPAIVEVERIIDPIEEASNFLKAVAAEMGIQIDVEAVKNGKYCEFHLSGSDLGRLIGKRGQTVNSLQLLTQLVANRYSKQYLTISLNVEGYKERRQEALENLAKRLAAQVGKTSKRLILEPMPAHERKIIHQVLKGHPLVKTASIEEGLKRKIVIEPVSNRKP